MINSRAIRFGSATKFMVSMGTVTSVGLAISYYKRKDNKINLIVGLDGPLFSIKRDYGNNYQDYQPDFRIGRSWVTPPNFTITSNNKVYDVWTRPYASLMFYMLQPFCNFRVYTSLEEDMTNKILYNVEWGNRFIERRYGNSSNIYEETNCGNIVLLITSFNELYKNQDNIAYPFDVVAISKYNESKTSDYELIRFTGRMIYRFFSG